jgi:hypothetical protein
MDLQKEREELVKKYQSTSEYKGKLLAELDKVNQILLKSEGAIGLLDSLLEAEKEDGNTPETAKETVKKK